MNERGDKDFQVALDASLQRIRWAVEPLAKYRREEVWASIRCILAALVDGTDVAVDHADDERRQAQGD